jgi:DNA repair exonuclease SbcCD ATPase subunit
MGQIDWQREDGVVRDLDIKLAHLAASLEDEEKELENATTHHERAIKAQEILQQLAQAVQQRAHQKIAEVVTSCLEAVFDDPYSFHIEFERKRGKTEARLKFKRGGMTVDPLNSTGGGVVDVASFALRVACLILHRPRLSKVMVLDEPFKFVSAQYRDRVRTMLERLSQDLDMQIIMVSHIDELETGKVIEL